MFKVFDIVQYVVNKLIIKNILIIKNKLYTLIIYIYMQFSYLDDKKEYVLFWPNVGLKDLLKLRYDSEVEGHIRNRDGVPYYATYDEERRPQFKQIKLKYSQIFYYDKIDNKTKNITDSEFKEVARREIERETEERNRLEAEKNRLEAERLTKESERVAAIKKREAESMEKFLLQKSKYENFLKETDTRLLSYGMSLNSQNMIGLLQNGNLLLSSHYGDSWIKLKTLNINKFDENTLYRIITENLIKISITNDANNIVCIYPNSTMDKSIINISIDGGKNWKTQEKDLTRFFVSSNGKFVVGVYPNKLIVSEDSGMTFNERSNGNTFLQDDFNISFDGKLIICRKDKFILMVSKDYGNTFIDINKDIFLKSILDKILDAKEKKNFLKKIPSCKFYISDNGLKIFLILDIENQSEPFCFFIFSDDFGNTWQHYDHDDEFFWTDDKSYNMKYSFNGINMYKISKSYSIKDVKLTKSIDNGKSWSKIINNLKDIDMPYIRDINIYISDDERTISYFIVTSISDGNTFGKKLLKNILVVSKDGGNTMNIIKVEELTGPAYSQNARRGGNYYEKYLKYKNKYLELKNSM